MSAPPSGDSSARASAGARQQSFAFARREVAPGSPQGLTLGMSADVTFVELPCRSVINAVDGSRLSGFCSINPYRGCEHACAYCFARYTHEFLDQKPTEAFERTVFVKIRAPDIFARDLRRCRDVQHRRLQFGSATDPYQPAEARFQITRRMLEKLLPLSGLSLSIITKSPLVERDGELLSELARRNDVEVIVSCAFTDRSLQRTLEPRVVAPERRLDTLARLSELGLSTGLLIAPILPGISDSEEALTELCRRARQAGARRAFGQTLFLSGSTREVFFEWLRQHRPQLLDSYRRGYARGMELDEHFRSILQQRLAGILERTGLSGKSCVQGRDDPLR